jgi:hypothetical protein
MSSTVDESGRDTDISGAAVEVAEQPGGSGAPEPPPRPERAAIPEQQTERLDASAFAVTALIPKIEFPEPSPEPAPEAAPEPVAAEPPTAVATPVADPEAPTPALGTAVAAKPPAPPTARPGGKVSWREAVPYEETGVLIRPAEWSNDRIETAMINVAGLRGKAEAESDQPRRKGLMRLVPPPRRGVLIGIMVLQTLLSLRNTNTAFEDEAFYIYSGHLELAHLLHGTAITDYASFSSGAPVLYPAFSAILDQVGGLLLVRLFSLLMLLCSTGLVYLTARRLLGTRSALAGAALFACTPAAIFMGGLATYDATAVFLLALSAWIVVRAARSPWPYYILALLPMLLAVGVKYASLLFIPTVIVLAGLSVLPYHGWRWALVRPVSLSLMFASMAYGALKLAGASYETGIKFTTTSRAQGTTPTFTLLKEAARWGAPMFAVALLGAFYYVFKPRYDLDAGAQPGRKGRLALALLLIGTALLAPADQIKLHTDVSFHKHIGFGLMFVAPMAGYGLVRLVGDHFARLQLSIGVWVVAMALGISQSTILFGAWPNSVSLVATIAKYEKPNGQYLVEIDEVPIYYLRGDTEAEPDQFTSTFSFQYQNAKGQVLTGNDAYTSAVQEGYFTVIAYDNITTPDVDNAIMNGISTGGQYRQVASLPERTAFGYVTYQVWVKK